MAFLARMLLPEQRAKLYLHEYGYENAFGGGQAGLVAGRAYFLETVTQVQHILPLPDDFMLAALWGDDGGSRMAEMFAYKGIEKWPGNPTVYSLVFRNGVYEAKTRQIACEDMMLAFSDESAFRRTTKSPEEFLYGIAPCRFFLE